MKGKSNIRGVTLIELLVALVISALLVGAMYSVYITQARTYTVQDRVSELQQDARSAFAVMTRDIRMAGFLTGPGSATGFTVANGAQSPITINGFSYAVTPVNSDSAPDGITVVYCDPLLGVVSSVVGTTITFTQGIGDAIQANDPVAFDLHPGSSGGTVYLVQSTVTSGSTDVTVTALPSDIVEDERAYRVRTVTYDVSNGVLRRNAYDGAAVAQQALAGDGVSTVVEDLQFVYLMEGGGTEHAPANPDEIEAVQINLIVRSAMPDPQETSFFKPAAGDRGQENTFSSCRRRMYTTTVKVRNL